ncbi:MULTISPECIES: TetR/AcrR family transcriptional regulator [unclassified Brevibacterium]|uniref:TetR/AcrR family transcriptional regulator n=1 Tax=unclassified Brevibacterium TaxID=2614124 RepID=UPI001E37F14C|nr:MULTISPECIES: TetR/AcrR family transcriptional regulator [unclassified Brevibacterium]MCD1286050.1 TetR family transcriptional regulator [Brevibacterium sp. CCUG 69071]MDK8433401.1 TetR/AcrR family transcriptional regulator [Brevibacterium sp. H-BE7]
MARPKNQKARREQLVHAAKRAIVERGLNGLRAIDVAAYSELGAGSVAYYYPDLGDLVREVHKDAVSRFYWNRRQSSVDDDQPRLKLRRTIRSGIPTSRDDIDFQVLNELHTHAYRDTFHAELMADLYRLEVSLYVDVLSEGAEAGEFTMTLSAETAASNLVAMEDAYGLHFMGGTPLEVDEIFRLILANAEVMTGCLLGKRLP